MYTGDDSVYVFVQHPCTGNKITIKQMSLMCW